MTNSHLTPPGGDPAAVRVGDAERNAAVTALGEHMATGRLDLDEYGTRSAVANTARTVGDLQALFTDLPAPHPVLPGAQVQPLNPRPAFVPTQGATGSAMSIADNRSRAQKFVAAASASSAIIALLLFFVTGQWWWFLLIPLISTVAGSIWGDSWKRPDGRD
ncbi:protein of unknown function [Nakamurella panacisegetis]|uniref:DUF1707 domain-containing protein n=1 Tax=Nakamurella panacisegetis TaxID=1090615 RepID=A0A1H0PES3_9ACTN|nr:DUF1707 domain-containing protein [Nakamurella panacisegetis]SDP03513.1 protein of unknown function [Nakamurella panacisegetis]